MKIRGVGVNIADMMPEVRNIRENGGEMQAADDLFGPEYEVTISEEGRKLIEGQTAEEVQEETKTQGVQDDEELRMLIGSIEESQRAERTRQGYYDELDEIEKQIKVLNAAYGRMKESGAYNDPLMKETAEQQRLLREEIEKQRDLQTEKAQKRLKEAQQTAAVQNSQYKEEIDENNRDLVTLLKTMEEEKKAEEQQENGGPGEDSDSASGTENSASDAIHNSAAGFMKSSLNREKSVEELSDMVGDSGHWFLSQANMIAQNLLKKGTFIKEAVGDKSFTDGQIDEMMQNYRSEVRAKSEEAYVLGSFGTQVLRDMHDVKMQRIADNPLQNMQKTKDAMMQAALDAALGEARQGSLDEASRKLEDEVERLIDERNDIGRIPKDKEEDEEEQGLIQEADAALE